jgi:hypothetical protein
MLCAEDGDGSRTVRKLLLSQSLDAEDELALLADALADVAPTTEVTLEELCASMSEAPQAAPDAGPLLADAGPVLPSKSPPALLLDQPGPAKGSPELG